MFIEPPFNYSGSKYKMLDQLIPMIDYNKKTFVDLFSGGGSVYTNIITEFDKIVVNDIIKDLVLVQKHLLFNDATIDTVKHFCVDKDDKDGYNNLRNDYNSNPTPEKLFALMLCCTNNMLRFNKKFEFNQTFGKRTYNIRTNSKINKYIKHVRPHLNKIIFSYKHFSEVPIVLNTTYYIDPPYGYIMEENGNIKNNQISEAGYNCYYNKKDDEMLYDYVHRINKVGSTFLMSGLLEHNGKKSWLLNKLIQDGFNWKLIDYDYNKVSRIKQDKNSKEIIIYNYNVNEDITFIISQNGNLVPMNSMFYKEGLKIKMNNIILAEYNTIEQVKNVLQQMAKSINKNMRVYHMPEKDFEVTKNWFI